MKSVRMLDEARSVTERGPSDFQLLLYLAFWCLHDCQRCGPCFDRRLAQIFVVFEGQEWCQGARLSRGHEEVGASSTAESSRAALAAWQSRVKYQHSPTPLLRSLLHFSSDSWVRLYETPLVKHTRWNSRQPDEDLGMVPHRSCQRCTWVDNQGLGTARAVFGRYHKAGGTV